MVNRWTPERLLNSLVLRYRFIASKLHLKLSSLGVKLFASTIGTKKTRFRGVLARMGLGLLRGQSASPIHLSLDWIVPEIIGYYRPKPLKQN